MHCPQCRTQLSELEVRTQWKYGFCKKCGGRAFAFGLLSKQVPLNHVLKLVAAARKSRQNTNTPCPDCKKPMVQALDQLACNHCQIFWILNFDSESLPKNRDPEKSQAQDDLDLNQSILDVQDELGRRVKVLFAQFPQLTQGKDKDNHHAPSMTPLIIMGLILVYILPIFAGTFNPPPPPTEYLAPRMLTFRYNQSDLDFVAKLIHFGFSVQDPNSALTRIMTAFFVQLTGFQLLLSLILVWIFGTRVESQMGTFGFALLCFASAAAGFYGTWYLGSESGSNYLIGSGGGIAGMLGFYLGFLIRKDRLKELKMPAFSIVGLSALSFVIFSQMKVSLGGVTVSSDSGWIWGASLGLVTAFIL